MKFNGIKLILGMFLLMAALPAIGIKNSWAVPPDDIENRLIYVDYSKRISMDFKNASLIDILKIFSKQSGMNFIAAADVSDKKLTLYIDQIPIEEALDKILSANGLTYEMAPNSDVFIVTSKPKTDLITRIFPLKYAAVASSKINSGGSSSSKGSTSSTSTAKGIDAAVKQVLTKEGKIEEDARTNSYIVTDVPSQFPLIEEIISKLDRPVPQILIEVEMLDVSKGSSDKIGIEYGNGGPFVSVTGSKRSSTFPFDESLVRDKTGKSPVLWTATTNGYDFTGMTAALDFLKSQNDSKILARPKLLTLNNQTARIEITTNEAIGLKSTTDNNSTTTSKTVQEAERTKTGVSLEVTPQANPVSGEIILTVTPKVSSAKQGGTFGGQTFKDPEDQTATAFLKVRNGETVIIGGLLRVQQNNSGSKLPLLGDIPLLGAAFRHRTADESSRELIIFITPYIIDDKTKFKAAGTPLNREYNKPDKMDVINGQLDLQEMGNRS